MNRPCLVAGAALTLSGFLACAPGSSSVTAPGDDASATGGRGEGVTGGRGLATGGTSESGGGGSGREMGGTTGAAGDGGETGSAGRGTGGMSSGGLDGAAAGATGATGATGGRPPGTGGTPASTGGRGSGAGGTGGGAGAATGGVGGVGLPGCTPAIGIPYSYACWPMPNPPTTGLPHPASYTDLGDGTVKDNVTGLIWQKAVAATQAFAWDTAKNYCASQALAGRTWRLPTRIELLSLVDFTRTSPALNVTAFPGTPGGKYYWTASPWVVSQIATKPQYSWIVNFYEGLTSNAGDR
ncbi:MAG: DUF1566 domain-containing protein, partial [Myxococcales bacterium]